MAVASGAFPWKIIVALSVLGQNGFYRRQRGSGGCTTTRGGLHPRVTPGRGHRLPLACGWPLGSPSGLRLRFVIKLILVNFRPIPRSFPKEDFLKYKTAEKQELALAYCQ